MLIICCSSAWKQSMCNHYVDVGDWDLLGGKDGTVIY